MVCPHGQGGRRLSQYGHFSNKGGGDKFFAILCGRPLWTAPYINDSHEHGLQVEQLLKLKSLTKRIVHKNKISQRP